MVMLALHGYDVYGLDISSTGIKTAQEYAETELMSPHPYNFGENYFSSGKGDVNFITANFFERDWENNQKFDLIYDYTVSIPIGNVR